MKRALYALLLLLAVVGAFLVGVSTQRASIQKGARATRTVLYYVDPMHPAYKSDKPGIAPDCGMELVPVYADGGMGGAQANASGLPPGAVNVSPEKQQLIGAKVAPVERAPRTHTVRMLGRVAPDETRIYRINAATDGWVKKILPVTTDSLVRQDELLATFYAPEFFSGIRAYIFGLRSLDRFETSRKETKEQLEQSGASIENYRVALRNLGMTEHQLEEIMRTRQSPESIDIRAPGAGFILARNVSLGQRFEKGTELYRIADLSKVWIVAEARETDAVAFKPEMPVRVSAPNLNKIYTARVAHVPPRFDPATRTLQVRLEVDNPELLLRPDMFVDVELPVTMPAAIAVSVDALVDGGLTKTVYVDRGEGVFEPRRVETGWRYGDRVEIVKGLMPGERILVSGTFLIDSESRMKAAAAGAAGPMNGGPVPAMEATAKDAMAPVVRAFALAKDPICGMDVNTEKATAAGLTAAYQGKTYYFDTAECKQQFLKDPARYAAAAAKAGGRLP